MSRRKILLKHTERCVLSDTLPYEIPLSFSNRYFYRFLVENKIRLSSDFKNILWETRPGAKNIEHLVRILFGLSWSAPVVSQDIVCQGITIQSHSVAIDFSSAMLRPFLYRIRHRDNDYRELAVCHPLGQLYLIAFYEKYKELILYYCNKSNFSIRRPDSVATHVYFNDKLHIESLGDDISYIEEYEKEYENIRSFFTYKDYSNVYKFYESYIYHRCEKKFNKLLKLDISKCFDSIYTHSLAWAILGKDVAKRKISITNQTFAGEFDRFMQLINYKETNGIIIGPEFSRIFAELILQNVDTRLEKKLNLEGHYHRQDYQIFRYVDDFFVFYNDESVKEKIVPNLQSILRDFKLYLNVNKQILFEKPIVTEISIAKHKISEMLEENLDYKLIEEVEDDGTVLFNGKINIKSKPLIIGFKTIVSESNVNTNDILSYTFAIIERKVKEMFRKYAKTSQEYKSEKNLIKSLSEIIDFIFFLYSFSSKVNLTIKLSRVLNLVIKFCRNGSTNIDFKHIIFQKIFENTTFFLRKNKSSEFSQVENLYLLTIVSELGKNYKVSEKLLEEYFRLVVDDNSYKEKHTLNYFSLMSMLCYIKTNKRYVKIRKFVVNCIVEKIRLEPDTHQNSELLFLALDSLSCPYIDNSSKRDILSHLGVIDPTLLSELLSDNYLSFAANQPVFFFKWDDFDFSRELDAKQSFEVY